MYDRGRRSNSGLSLTGNAKQTESSGRSLRVAFLIVQASAAQHDSSNRNDLTVAFDRVT